MIETRTKEIGGITYQVTQLPAMKGFKLQRRLAAILGPPAAEVMGGAVSVSELLKFNLNLGVLAPALRDLFERLTESELETITRSLLETAQVTESGKTGPVMPVFDTHFAGRYNDLYELIGFALEVNYGDFLGGLGARFASAQARTSPIAGSNTSSTPGLVGSSS